MPTTVATDVGAEPPAPHHPIGGPVGLLERMSGALRRRAFRWWFAGQVTSSSGTMTQAVALSWTVLGDDAQRRVAERGDCVFVRTVAWCSGRGQARWLTALIGGRY